jgi:hypothetical protein
MKELSDEEFITQVNEMGQQIALVLNGHATGPILAVLGALYVGAMKTAGENKAEVHAAIDDIWDVPGGLEGVEVRKVLTQ